MPTEQEVVGVEQRSFPFFSLVVRWPHVEEGCFRCTCSCCNGGQRQMDGEKKNDSCTTVLVGRGSTD